jgi:hypothetical protein
MAPDAAAPRSSRIWTPAGTAGLLGFRMWNGREEQMLTVFTPNPWLDPDAPRRYVDTPTGPASTSGCACASAMPASRGASAHHAERPRTH